MIFDTFIFFNELDLLELRFNILNDIVDYFVLVEAKQTFQGNPKPLFYEENKDRFAAFQAKIIHVVVDEHPEDWAPFDREHYQRDAIMRGLEGCRHDDLIMLSDVDEIPRPEAIPSEILGGKIYAFAQSLFYYKLNCKCIELEGLPWSIMTTYENFRTPSMLRKRLFEYHKLILSGNKSNVFEIIENGGWHFSYLGTEEFIAEKIKAFSHVELNTPEYTNLDHIKDSMSQGVDLFGRELTFRIFSVDGLPDYVKTNIDKYKKLGLLADEGLMLTNQGQDLNSYMILFDQYSRYRACADLLHQAGYVAGATVLDVGSGPECLFGKFMRGAAITYVDPLIQSGTDQTHISGNVFASELDGRSFDCVSAVDVLEHIPSKHRPAFLERLSSLCTNIIILGFPSSDASDALETDKAIGDHYRIIFGHEYPWLREHFQYGLPALADTVAYLEHLGWHCQTLGHGHAPWLRELLSLVICIWEIPSLRNVVVDISKNFNFQLYPYDYQPPYYRQFVIASRRPLPPIIAFPHMDNLIEAKGTYRALIEDLHRQYFAASVKNLSEHLNEQIKWEAVAAERDAVLAERDAVLAERDAVAAERDAAVADRDLMKRSRSWRITGPFRLAGRLVRHGLLPEDRYKIYLIGHRVFDGLPLPVAVKDKIRWLYNRVFRFSYNAFRRGASAFFRFEPPKLQPAPQNQNKPDYVIWGIIDWHFRYQRPQQLAKEIAASGRRVFYVSVNLTDDERHGFDVEDLDSSGRLFQVKLYAHGAPTIYTSTPSADVVDQLRGSIGELLLWTSSRKVVSVVQHPFWYDIAVVLPNSRVVYDCMDHHEGFSNTAPEIITLEHALLRDADLTVTTSTQLDLMVADQARRRALIRNATDFEHFARCPDSVYRDSLGRKVLGYYGAIADWFDQDLVEAIARHFSDCSVLLVGADTVKARSRLGRLSNVTFVGEVPYKDLPYYLYGFDVCVLPFRITPLTLATNPVKVYEYLSAGKAVVSIALPEMEQFGDLVHVVDNPADFLATVAAALAQPDAPDLINKRKAFAREQTWKHRAEAYLSHVELDAHDPTVSVIVVTYNNLDLTKACLASLDEQSDYSAMEIIVVDNHSSDGSKGFLADWVQGAPNRRLILNEDNKGFAAANNQGLAIASGDYLVLLNNDTYVTPGWIRTLLNHLRRDKTIGLIGPVTNNIGNEAKIDIDYKSMEEMLHVSAFYTRRHIGQTWPLRTAAFFCAMMSRDVYQRVGLLDEAFGRGFFEDDDYCRRIEQLGLRIVCAEDVFIHHQLSAAFDQLKIDERQALFVQNKAAYEAKWGKWVPHGYRKKN